MVGAVFVDKRGGGDIRRSDFKTRTGVGVRWASPVGPCQTRIFTARTGRRQKERTRFYSFISVWGLNYEFYGKKNKSLRRVDFHCGVVTTAFAFLVGTTTGTIWYSVRGEPLGAGAGDWVTGGWRDLSLKISATSTAALRAECGRGYGVGLDCLWRSSLCVNDLALKTYGNVAIDGKNAAFRTGARRGRKRTAEPLRHGPSLCRAWR